MERQTGDMRHTDKVASVEMKATNTRSIMPRGGRKKRSSRLALTNIEFQAILDYMRPKRIVKGRRKGGRRDEGEGRPRSSDTRGTVSEF